MELSQTLLKKFVSTTTAESTEAVTTAYGTGVVNGTSKYVILDGSTVATPVSSTTDIEDGDRVLVSIENHVATVTGNMTSPSAILRTTESLSDSISAAYALITNLESTTITTEYLNATYATIDSLTAVQGSIDTLSVNKLDASTASLIYATIESLDATNASITNLSSVYASITDLDATNATIQSLSNTYANIDFSNIGSAAIEKFFSESGMIENLVVGDQTITGKLVGVTISGDLIEGNTIVAEKLVIKGEDGLYYKLNTDGITTEAEQTDYNSLNGTVIQAKSITAEKISVDDLVAFGATIGGFHIGTNSLYSDVKESVDNTTRGVYLDTDGQVAFGDDSQYLKFYKANDGTYRLEISAISIMFSSTRRSIEEVLDDTVTDVSVEYCLSASYEDAPSDDDDWSTVAPSWVDGMYMWSRVKTTKTGGVVEYSDYTCITGATGATGADGTDGKMVYATCSTAASTAAKVATTTDGDFTLYTGAVVSVKFTVTNTASSPTLNVDGTGAIPIYYRGSAITASYLAANRTYSFVYNGTQWEFLGDINTDTDTYDRTKFTGSVKAGSTITADNIIVGNSSGYHQLNTGGSFDITYPILYAMSAIGSGSTGTNNYTEISFTVTTTQSITLTAYKYVYIQGSLTGTSFTPTSTAPLIQTVPTSADGYYYICLGLAYSQTGIHLDSSHEIFMFYNGAFQSLGSSAREVVANWCYDNDTTWISGANIYTGTITADKISVTDLQAFGATIGGWTIGDTSLYNGCVSMDSTVVGTYIGTDGIRQYEDSGAYVNIQNGILTAAGVDVSGTVSSAVIKCAGSTYTAQIDSGVLKSRSLEFYESPIDAGDGYANCAIYGGKIVLSYFATDTIATGYDPDLESLNQRVEITPLGITTDGTVSTSYLAVTCSDTSQNAATINGTTVATDNFTVIKDSASMAGYYAARSDTSTSILFGIGSNGTTHGMYSATLGRWMVYSDGTDAIGMLDYLTVKDTEQYLNSGTTRRQPVCSIATAGARAAYVTTSLSSSTYRLLVRGEYGTSGTFINRYFYSDASSDVRLKTNIKDTEVAALPILNQIQMRQFDWIDTWIHQDIGPIADEMEILDPGFVNGGDYDENGDMDPKAINMLYLSSYLIKGIQELSAQVDELKAQLEELTSE